MQYNMMDSQEVIVVKSIASRLKRVEWWNAQGRLEASLWTSPMNTVAASALVETLAQLSDPRVDRTKLYNLTDTSAHGMVPGL